MLTAAPSTLCREIFLSAPYSTTVPKKPALRAQGDKRPQCCSTAPSSQQVGSRTPALPPPTASGQHTARILTILVGLSTPQFKPWAPPTGGNPRRGLRMSHVTVDRAGSCINQLHPQTPGWGQHSLQGPFHARLIIVLEFVLIADQGEGVRDSELRRQGETWLVAGTLWAGGHCPGLVTGHAPQAGLLGRPPPGSPMRCGKIYP